MKQAHKIFGNIKLPGTATVGFPKPYSILSKLRILNICSKTFRTVRFMEYDEPYLIQDCSISPFDTVIALADLVGSSRQEGYVNWIESLNSLQRGRNFDLVKQYGLSRLQHDLLNPTEQLPQVIENKGKYYIAGDGKHRLTMAKCCGIQQAKVNVIVAQ
ncbi:hypothetical protein M2G63_22660 [Vibrio vulnificus]|nr:hypothetical protein [Vibrio vulnificus]MCU8540827.1 hypothetical protein [Vibrio vulnificus]MCU8545227.1 hypothetical protein [Vibrio vulnificus]